MLAIPVHFHAMDDLLDLRYKIALMIERSDCALEAISIKESNYGETH